MGDHEDIFFMYDMKAMESEYDTVEESTIYSQQNFVRFFFHFLLLFVISYACLIIKIYYRDSLTLNATYY